MHIFEHTGDYSYRKVILVLEVISHPTYKSTDLEWADFGRYVITLHFVSEVKVILWNKLGCVTAIRVPDYIFQNFFLNAHPSERIEETPFK